MDRLALLRKHLRSPITSVWAEPFHEAWMAGEGLDFRVRLARAQAAEMAAALKPALPRMGADAAEAWFDLKTARSSGENPTPWRRLRATAVGGNRA